MLDKVLWMGRDCKSAVSVIDSIVLQLKVQAIETLNRHCDLKLARSPE